MKNLKVINKENNNNNINNNNNNPNHNNSNNINNSSSNINVDSNIIESQSIGNDFKAQQITNEIKKAESILIAKPEQTLNNNSIKIEEISSDLEKKFKLEKNYQLIHSCACAFLQKIPLQGKIYVFTSKVCFHSYFNSTTIFGKTVLIIPIDDIISMKTKSVFYTKTAISLEIKNGNDLVFTTFISPFQRENTIKALEKIKSFPENKENNNNEKKELIKIEKIPESIKRNVINKKYNINLKKKKKGKENNENNIISQSINNNPINFSNRKEKLMKEIVPLHTYKESFVKLFHEISINEIFQLFYSDYPKTEPLTYKRKAFKNFYELILSENNDIEINYTNWSSIPLYFKSDLLALERKNDEDYNTKLLNYKEELRNEKSFSEREFNFKHPIKEKVPWAPSHARVKERHKIFWVSDQEIIVQIEGKLSDIPYCDYFYIKKCYIIKEVEPNLVEICSKFWVEVHKSTWFKARIENSSVNENAELYNKIVSPSMEKIYKEYLVKRDEKKMKNNKENVGEKDKEKEEESDKVIEGYQNEMSRKITEGINDQIVEYYEKIISINKELKIEVSYLKKQVFWNNIFQIIIAAILALIFKNLFYSVK